MLQREENEISILTWANELFAREYVYHGAYSLRLIGHLRENVMSEFGKSMEGVRSIFSL